MASLPSRPFVEFNVGNPLIEELIDNPFRLDAEGCLPVPQGPGLGITLDRDRLHFLEKSGFASPSWTWDDRMEFEVPR
jgi:L-alanine-DL-glutamate epimerase-like enolase superfamily enzyme